MHFKYDTWTQMAAAQLVMNTTKTAATQSTHKPTQLKSSHVLITNIQFHTTNSFKKRTYILLIQQIIKSNPDE